MKPSRTWLATLTCQIGLFAPAAQAAPPPRQAPPPGGQTHHTPALAAPTLPAPSIPPASPTPSHHPAPQSPGTFHYAPVAQPALPRQAAAVGGQIHHAPALPAPSIPPASPTPSYHPAPQSPGT